ncbi:hypothetical protein JDV02_002344 [Purpureocillium takamizusanense]|uniref:N-acetyltransferase domain-containing protein n=1 Tax=Purpureocillium takamizusanense TaxID=2060973 RepID=A0A9Q8QAT9_9HYPO|nr:uncharacterized protein JDV02_002344 [Purpureocillium takamizusanense]UNI15851.1 hypothetical protein JDV02_002344 [Purpureocillium takamizusanense]
MAVQDRTLVSPNPPGGEPGAVLVETERLLIRRYVAADAQLLAAAADHASIGDGLRDRFPSPYTLADAEAFLARHGGPVENRYPVHAAIFVKKLGDEKARDAAASTDARGDDNEHTSGSFNNSQQLQYIGALGVMPGDDVEYRTWELGYWLTPAGWGRGYMTEAVRGFTRWAFATWPALHRIEATPFSSNPQSCRLLGKCGFVEEGRRRGAAEKKGAVVDIVVFGLLRSDVVVVEAEEETTRESG